MSNRTLDDFLAEYFLIPSFNAWAATQQTYFKNTKEVFIDTLEGKYYTPASLPQQTETFWVTVANTYRLGATSSAEEDLVIARIPLISEVFIDSTCDLVVASSEEVFISIGTSSGVAFADKEDYHNPALYDNTSTNSSIPLLIKDTSQIIRNYREGNYSSGHPKNRSYIPKHSELIIEWDGEPPEDSSIRLTLALKKAVDEVRSEITLPAIKGSFTFFDSILGSQYDINFSHLSVPMSVYNLVSNSAYRNRLKASGHYTNYGRDDLFDVYDFIGSNYTGVGSKSYTLKIINKSSEERTLTLSPATGIESDILMGRDSSVIYKEGSSWVIRFTENQG